MIQLTPQLARDLRQATLDASRRAAANGHRSDSYAWPITSGAGRHATRLLAGDWEGAANIVVDRDTCSVIQGFNVVEAVLSSGVAVDCQVEFVP
jgi:hypothetical protein